MELRTRATKGRSVETQSRRKEDQPPTFPKGRVCCGTKCPPGTMLSIYNGGSECDLCHPRTSRIRPISSIQELRVLMEAAA